MDPTQKARFDGLHTKLVATLKTQGMSPKTVDSYSRAVRQLAQHFGCCPDSLGVDELTLYFADLTDRCSWSTIKVVRNGIQFFWKHVLHRHWDWVDIVKPPQVKRLPEVMSVDETRRVLDALEKLRYRACLFTIYSMGLRLGEGITLAAADIDRSRMQVHIRGGKGRKDRYVPLPHATLHLLERYWHTHRNRTLLFPNVNGAAVRIANTKRCMDRGGVQGAHSKPPCATAVSVVPSAFTPCGIPTPLTFSKPASTCASSSSTSATRARQRPPSTPT